MSVHRARRLVPHSLNGISRHPGHRLECGMSTPALVGSRDQSSFSPTAQPLLEARTSTPIALLRSCRCTSQLRLRDYIWRIIGFGLLTTTLSKGARRRRSTPVEGYLLTAPLEHSGCKLHSGILALFIISIYRFVPANLLSPNNSVGTASEHHTLYQYQLANTKNIFLGFVQTETP